MASRKGSSAEAMAAADQPRDVDADFFDPVHEWINGGANYLLCLNLPGFKKEEFQVQVDLAGRLTIRGQRLADDGAGSVQLHKVYQLPPTSDLDGITSRFDGGVLTLTVPKLPLGAVAPPQATEEEEEEEEEEDDDDDDFADKPRDQKAKVDREAERTKAAKRQDKDDKAKAEHKAKLDREAERWIEAARERLAKAEREREKGRRKERAAEEGFKWAEAIGKKEMIATAVAAFTLGVFVSHKIFSRN